MSESASRKSALILSTKAELARELREVLESEGWRTIVVNSLGPARKLIQREDVGLVVMDPNELSGSLEQFANALHDADSPVPLVAVAGANGLQPTSILGIEPDAILDLPVEPAQFRRTLDTVLQRSRSDVEDEILGRSDAIREIRETIAQISAVPVNVLITGETGTGKTYIAQGIHKTSTRSAGPFLTLNCGAIPETLLESELFGHEKGAFTDAGSRRQGIFEAAHGGTVFLDEIGEMSPSAQVRLLHVLESREVTRLGSTKPIKVDVRLIAATNLDLQRAVRDKQFRSDLFYRLKVVEIRVPSLRQRQEDIALLVDRFIQDYALEHNVPPVRIAPEGMERLKRHQWPGNIRELKNLIERLMVLSPERDVSSDSVQAILRDLSGGDGNDGSVEEPSNLPVWLGKSPEESYRDLLYWAVLEVARDVKELKSMLAGQRSDLQSLPAFNSSFSAVGDTDAEFSETDENLVDPSRGEPKSGIEGIKPLEEVEREAIARALVATGGHRKKAAKLLRMPERTLYRKIRQFDL